MALDIDHRIALEGSRRLQIWSHAFRGEGGTL